MGGNSTTVEQPRNTLSKSERLTSKKLMDELFNKGSSIVLEPIRLIWMKTTLPSSSLVQVVFTVPKKSFPRAVDRNKIKRLLRESFRLHKHELYNCLKKSNKTLSMGLIYSGKKIFSYKEVESKIIVVLNRLIESNEFAEGND